MTKELDGAPRNARLPEDLEEVPVREVQVGERGWAAAWDIEVDTARRLWMQSRLTLEPQPRQNFQVHVERVEDGYVVDISRAPEQRWNVDDAEDASYYDTQDPDNPECLPVVRIIRSSNQVEPSYDNGEPEIRPRSPGVFRRLGSRLLGRQIVGEG